MHKLGLCLILISLFFTPQNVWAETKKTTKDSTAVKQGYNGDPAAKRGSLIGYDLGRAKGRADKESKAKASPQTAPDFINAEKFHRSEYGLRANFVAGFKKGFVSGYSSAYKGEKVGAKTKAGDTILIGGDTAPKTEIRKVNVRDDAL